MKPTIRKVTRKKQLKNGIREYTSWVVDIGRQGGKNKGRFHSFKTKSDAERFAARKRIEANRYGRAGIGLSDDQRTDALKALKLLNGNTSMEDAARFLLKHRINVKKQITVEDLYTEYLEGKRNLNRRPTTIKDIQDRLGRYTRANPKLMLSDVTLDGLEEWLNKNITTPHAKKAVIGAIKTFFKYAEKRRYIGYNPASLLEAPHVETNYLPTILSTNQVKLILCTAMNCDDGIMIPYFSLGIFAGLRPYAIRQLEWKHVDVKNGNVYVPSNICKTKRDRYVDISDNLNSWLTTSPEQHINTIFYSRSLFNKVIDAAKIKWTQDCMRHTFGSQHYCLHNDALKTANQMGHHGNTNILFRHYKKAVTKKDNEKFWDIIPTMKHCTGCNHG